MNCENFAFEIPHLFPDHKAHTGRYRAEAGAVPYFTLQGCLVHHNCKPFSQNHLRNKVCGHACVTFIHPQAQIAGAQRQTWDKPSAITHTEADCSPESRMNVNVILRAIISLIARHYVVKTEYFASALVQVLLFETSLLRNDFNSFSRRWMM